MKKFKNKLNSTFLTGSNEFITTKFLLFLLLIVLIFSAVMHSKKFWSLAVVLAVSLTRIGYVSYLSLLCLCIIVGSLQFKCYLKCLNVLYCNT